MAKPLTFLIPARQTNRLTIPNHTRSFSSTCPTQSKLNRIVARNVRNTPTMERRYQNLKQTERPDDMGLVPDTFIRPATSDLPSFFSKDFKRRLRIEWRVISQKVLGMGQLIYQKKWQVPKDPTTGKKIRKPLELYGRITTARKLHAEYYTALARNNLHTIEDIACTGLKRFSQARISRQTWNDSTKHDLDIEYIGREKESSWLLEALTPAYFKSARIIADRFVQTPLGEDSRLRQVVVLIKSRQTLKTPSGEVVKRQDMTEYVVVQQLSNGDQVDPWKLWGTTSPSTDKDIDRLLAVDPNQLTFMERVRNGLQGMGSKAGGATS